MENSEPAWYCLPVFIFFRENCPETDVPGVPHRLMEDDVYEGWFIPAGAVVFDNPWYVT